VTFKKVVNTPSKHGHSADESTIRASTLDSYTGVEQIKMPNKEKQKQLRVSLVAFRRERQLSQKQLAAMLNVTPDIIASVESGKTVPDSRLVQRVKSTLHNAS
jgi:ribosome-binding protein aMBF1 (putative translation factor)